MTDKDFTMVMLDELEINLCGDGTLYVYDSHSSFHQRFEPGDRFYKEILIEWKERADLYERNLAHKFYLTYDTACKMAPFFKIDYDHVYCIKDDEENFMQLTYEEFNCFKGVLGEAIDRGYGLMFNKFKK